MGMHAVAKSAWCIPAPRCILHHRWALGPLALLALPTPVPVHHLLRRGPLQCPLQEDLRRHLLPRGPLQYLLRRGPLQYLLQRDPLQCLLQMGLGRLLGGLGLLQPSLHLHMTVRLAQGQGLQKLPRRPSLSRLEHSTLQPPQHPLVLLLSHLLQDKYSGPAGLSGRCGRVAAVSNFVVQAAQRADGGQQAAERDVRTEEVSLWAGLSWPVQGLLWRQWRIVLLLRLLLLLLVSCRVCGLQRKDHVSAQLPVDVLKHAASS